MMFLCENGSQPFTPLVRPHHAAGDLDPAEAASSGPASATSSTTTLVDLPLPGPDGTSAAALAALANTARRSGATEQRQNRRRRKLRLLKRQLVTLSQHTADAEQHTAETDREFSELSLEKIEDMFLVGMLTFAVLLLVIILATAARAFLLGQVSSPSLRAVQTSASQPMDLLNMEEGIKGVGGYGKYNMLEFLAEAGDLKEG